MSSFSPLARTVAIRRALAVVWALFLAACGTDQVCGSGTWHPGRLEIHHLPLGQADATLIVAPSGRSLLIDSGETSWEGRAGAEAVGAAIERTLGCRRIDTAVITHFHLDHVGAPGRGGLSELVARERVAVGTTWHRDLWHFRADDGATLEAWRRYLASPASDPLHARIIDAASTLDLGPEVSVRFVASDGAGRLRAGGSTDTLLGANENDHSVVLWLRFGRIDYVIGGDLSGEWTTGVGSPSHDIETAVARYLPDIDVYRVNHHGSNHSSNPTFLAQIDPEVSVISVGDPSPYGHPGAATLARLQATGAVYLTAPSRPRRGRGMSIAGGEIVLTSVDGVHYSVAGVIEGSGVSQRFAHDYVATDPARVDGDGDGYFVESDPDDADPQAHPAPVGGCDPILQTCDP